MDTILAEFLHDFGFAYANRKFKLFTFSKIFGKIKEKGEKFITFKPPNIHFYFSSPIKTTAKSLINRTIKSERMRLSNNNVELIELEVLEEIIEGNSLEVVSLSPIVAYKTPPGSKRHEYLSPFDGEFYKLLKENLIKKYNIVYGKGYKGELEISPIKVKDTYKRKVVFNGTLIVGWEGLFRIEGEGEILKVALESGLGAKNSAGFGCIISKRNDKGFKGMG
jgi:CRISPR-associated protein Cas6